MRVLTVDMGRVMLQVEGNEARRLSRACALLAEQMQQAIALDVVSEQIRAELKLGRSGHSMQVRRKRSVQDARVELLGGDLALAQREVQADCDFLAAKGETYFLSTMAALLARLARDQGRDDEALAMTRTAEAATADDDMESQALWRMVRAPLLAL